MNLFKRKWLWLTVLIVIIAIVGYLATTRKPGARVALYHVDVGQVDRYVEDTAVVKSQETTTYYAALTGTIQRVAVAVGDQLEAGDSLIDYDLTDLTFQRDQLSATRKGLSANQREVTNPNNGNQIKQFSSLVAKARANVGVLERQLAVQRELLRAGAASAESARTLSDQLAAANKDLQTAIAQLNQAKQGNSDNVINQANSQLDVIDIKLAQLEYKLAQSPLVAKSSGVVVTRQVNPGQFVTVGSPLLTVENNDETELEAMLLADDIVDLKMDSEVEVMRDNTVIALGRVSKIAPKAETRTSDLGVDQKRVKVTIRLNEMRLKLGYEYDIKVYIKRLKTLKIPDSAYFTIDDRGYVFTVVDNVLQLKEVKKLFAGNDALAVEGLSAGTIIVETPNSDLEVGMKVEADN